MQNPCDLMRRRADMPGLIALWLMIAMAQPAVAIVNGAPVSDERFANEFPWAVALVSSASGGVCTGQLISSTWVLTAAHCTHLGMRLVLGHADRTSAEGVVPAEAIKHPRYDAKNGDFDVGLLRLPAPVTIPPLPLLSEREAGTLLQADRRALIAGWGKRSPRLGHSERYILSDVELRGLRREGTRLIYFDPVSGPCGGDSGGPLLLARADGSLVLAGIASRVVGNLCAQGGGIGIYVDIGKVQDFIRRHVPDLPRR